jgi:hypothetical protein
MFNKKRTLRKAKKHDPGSKRYNLHKQAKATLGGGNARLAVKKPDDETLEDWLAMNSTCAGGKGLTVQRLSSTTNSTFYMVTFVILAQKGLVHT